jgi:hypothetical protein
MESPKKVPPRQVEKTLLDGVAVCEKNTAGVVSFQSPESVAICGHKSGEFCNDCHRDRDIGQNCELVADRIYYHQQVYSRVEIQKNQTHTTILVPDAEPRFELESVLERVHLSPREKEIAGLIAKNQSNAQLIDALIISESTLKSHLNSIYRKIPELKVFRDRLR